MTYDFTSVYNRSDIGSWKWQAVDDLTDQGCSGHVPMTVADMDFPTAPEIKEALHDYIDEHVLGYTAPTDTYLQAVKDFYRERHQTEIGKDWIVTSAGVVPALATSVRAYTDPGDGVIIFSPVYPPFYSVIEDQGRQVVECPLLLEDNRYYLDFEQLEACAEDAKMVILCSPHNPGGRVWTEAELKRLADIVIRHELVLVSDEIHGDLVHSDHPHRVALTVDSRLSERTIIAAAASKSFNIAGMQCSNIIIPDRKLREAFVNENARIGVQAANALGMVATEAAYTKGGAWLDAVTQLMKKHLDLVTEFFEEWDPRWQVMEQDASFLAWVGFGELFEDTEAFYNLLSDRCHFFVNPGDTFGGASKYYMRINVGLPTEQLEENLACLKKNLSPYLK